MRTARKMLSLSLVAGLLVAMTVVFQSNTVQARPKYKTVMAKTYKDNEQVKMLGCLNCHGKKEDGKPDNKKRNPYGVAVGKALGAKKVEEAEKIEEALTKAAAEKSAVEGKTFGELIEAGMAPYTAPAE